MSAVVVEISSVFAPSAVKVSATEIRAGDSVFTTFGERIEVKRVRVLRDLIKVTRVDGWTDYFLKDERITIVKA